MEQENNNISNSQFLLNKETVLITTLIIAIFIMDINLPLGVAGGVPYIAVILFTLWSPTKNIVIYLAFVCSLLTIAGFLFSPQGGELWMVLVNRVLALFAIWITAILAVKWKISECEISRLTLEQEIEKKKIYAATIHGAQHITYNLLNELELVKLEIEHHPDFDRNVAEMFNDMLREAFYLMDALSKVEIVDEDKIKQSVHPSIESKTILETIKSRN